MIASRIQKIPPSGIREFFDLVLGMPDVISLGVGEPDFVTPWCVREKAISALEDGLTSYTSNKGLFILRKAITQHLQKRYGLQYDPEEEIMISVGVSEALDLAVRTVLEPNDKAIVVSPYYVAYPALVEITSGKVLYLKTREENDFKIEPEELEKLVDKNPKAIIFNYPSNPTGITYTRDELKTLWKILSRKKIVIISDETYDELTYEGKHFPFPMLDKEARERTIYLNGFSKGYAMTGFRLGYACGNKNIISAMTKIHSFAMLCAPIISQSAAIEALRAQNEVAKMRAEYKRRGAFMARELNRLGLTTVKPQGAFYCFSSIKKYKLPALEFAKKLLFEKKVAVVPGTAFGMEFGDYIRISYANSFEKLKEAIVRIEELVKTLGQK